MPLLDATTMYDKTPRLLTVGAGDQISNNIFDAGVAKKVFGGDSMYPMRIQIGYKMTAGVAAATFRARLVAADDVNLSVNPVIIDDTGVQALDMNGNAFAIGSQFYDVLFAADQPLPKRYYGVLYTQSGADQNGQVTAVGGADVQSNMPARRAAVP